MGVGVCFPVAFQVFLTKRDEAVFLLFGVDVLDQPHVEQVIPDQFPRLEAVEVLLSERQFIVAVDSQQRPPDTPRIAVDQHVVERLVMPYVDRVAQACLSSQSPQPFDQVAWFRRAARQVAVEVDLTPLLLQVLERLHVQFT